MWAKVCRDRHPFRTISLFMRSPWGACTCWQAKETRLQWSSCWTMALTWTRAMLRAALLCTGRRIEVVLRCSTAHPEPTFVKLDHPAFFFVPDEGLLLLYTDLLLDIARMCHWKQMGSHSYKNLQAHKDDRSSLSARSCICCWRGERQSIHRTQTGRPPCTTQP